MLAGLAVWFACGRHLGLYTLIYSLVPGMGWFRVPARSLFLANLAVFRTSDRMMGSLLDVVS